MLMMKAQYQRSSLFRPQATSMRMSLSAKGIQSTPRSRSQA
jgi:hypothetical protein